MTYKKQRNWGIFLLLSPIIVGILRFVMSIVFFVIAIVSTPDVAPEDLEPQDAEAHMKDNLELNRNREIRNYLFMILSGASIPAFIIGIVLIATNKRHKDKKNVGELESRNL